ncbi:DnaJ domain-containing protein [Nocardioides plantarum]|uniref:DnaJ domain-containing protein n=1 Tax=Nocardioides plantarum TaxID=29299 RepID=A0ABV5KGW5_9ACTN
MERTEALAVLELAEGASIDDVRKAYRRLATQHHPDAGGSPEHFNCLLQAQELLLAPPSTAMVPIDQVTEIVRMATQGSEARARQLELARDTSAVVRQAIRIRTTRLARQQRQVSALTVVSVFVGSGTQPVRLLPGERSVVATALGLFFAMTAAVLGFALLVLTASQVGHRSGHQGSSGGTRRQSAVGSVVRPGSEATRTHGRMVGRNMALSRRRRCC